MDKPTPTLLSRETNASGKFLSLETIRWRDAQGRERSWECSSRTNGHGRAVMVIARLMPERTLVLVRQFRPPAGTFCIEFPAGLVEPDEEFSQAALRELAEETGYVGEVAATIPYGFSSAGLTDEVIAGVIVDIPSETYRAQPPTPHPEETEDIEVLLVPEATLDSFLRDRLAAGDSADAKLLTFAACICLHSSC